MDHLLKILLVDNLSLQSLKVLHGHKAHQGVKLLLGILSVISHSLQTHANTSRHIPNTLSPHRLVQARVQADVRRVHSLRGEIADGLDGGGSALLELAAVHVLVEVDGVLAGDEVGDSGARALGGSSGGHLFLMDGYHVQRCDVDPLLGLDQGVRYIRTFD